MNKADIISKMAEEADITRAAAERAYSAFLNAIREGLQQGDKITLIGFGSFFVSERKARRGRNPQTGEPLEIPASKAVKFSPAKGLKEAIS